MSPQFYTTPPPTNPNQRPTPGWFNDNITPSLISHFHFKKHFLIAISRFRSELGKFKILVEIPEGYVIWTYDANTGGYSNGNYFVGVDREMLLKEAMMEFCRLVAGL